MEKCRRIGGSIIGGDAKYAPAVTSDDTALELPAPNSAFSPTHYNTLHHNTLQHNTTKHNTTHYITLHCTALANSPTH